MAKEELLEVAVDLGGKGGALGVIEKARRVMGERLGNVRTWQDLPVSRHFACCVLPDGNLGVRADASAGSTFTFESAISLRLCLPRLEGASDRSQSTQDAHVRPCSRARKPHQDVEGRVSRTARIALKILADTS